MEVLRENSDLLKKAGGIYHLGFAVFHILLLFFFSLVFCWILRR